MLFCGYGCYQIGGPWIAENPGCPIHGENPVEADESDLETRVKLMEDKIKELEDRIKES